MIRMEEANLMEKLEENTSVNVSQVASALKVILRAQEMCPFCGCLFCTLWIMGFWEELLFRITKHENKFPPSP